MKKVLVYFYGYKSKLLPQAVDQLVKNQSGQNKIDIVVYDQRNVCRPEKFLYVEYNHVHWDSLISRFRYMETLKRRQGFDFFMYVDGSKMFEKDWDLELINSVDGKQVILSGNHDIVFDKNNYKFYPKYKKTYTKSSVQTNWVVKDFFFIPFSLFEALPDVSIFKYHGVEEHLSLYAADKDIPVISLRTDAISDEEPDILENDFIPFSIYHNYSKVIDSFKLKNNLSVDKLSRILDYDFRSLDYFPYPVNDVEYNFLSNLDKISEQRFHTIQKGIY